MAKEPPRVLVGVRLPVALASRLKVEAARRRTTAQAMVEAAVRAYLKGVGHAAR